MNMAIINPLPEDLVGVDLLEKLTVEWIKDRLKLKEDWEDGAYTYEEVEDIAGMLLVASIAPETEAVALRMVQEQTGCGQGKLKAVIARLKAGSTRAVTGNEVSPKSRRLDDLLILGMGWPSGAIKCENLEQGNAALSVAAEKYFGITKGAVHPRHWERAKADARRRLHEHLERQDRRKKYRMLVEVKQAVLDRIRKKQIASELAVVEEFLKVLRPGGMPTGTEEFCNRFPELAESFFFGDGENKGEAGGHEDYPPLFERVRAAYGDINAGALEYSEHILKKLRDAGLW